MKTFDAAILYQDDYEIILGDDRGKAWIFRKTLKISAGFPGRINHRFAKIQDSIFVSGEPSNAVAVQYEDVDLQPTHFRKATQILWVGFCNFLRMWIVQH